MIRRRQPRALLLLPVIVAALLLAPATSDSAAAQAPSIDELRADRGPLDPSVPAPEATFGFHPGADFHLATWTQILEYFEVLDAASERIRVEEIGTSTEGRRMILALVSSPENLAEADRYRDIAARRARAEIDDEEARRLASEGKTIVWIDSGLHATEVAHAQHAPELAYLTVAGESPEMQRIREDTILLLMPNLNPDGLDITVDWYESNLGTPWETSGLPVLYQKYVGHDNNRDWYMITQAETRAVARQLYRVWYPQIVYNHHQTAPFPARIFVPPFAEPANPNIPPLVLRGIARVGNAITTRLESENKPGAVQQLGFTAWWNGGMRTAPYFHNMVGILTETALFRYATPNFYPPESLPDQFRTGLSTRERSVHYPDPWPGGWWRLRDAVDYMLTASIATLDVGSRYREDWLLNIWRMGRHAIETGERGHPAAWLIPPDQWDDGAAAELVNVLLRGGLEVHRAEEEFFADDVAYPAGTYVVPASQAFRYYAADLLEPQEYPDRRLYPEGPPDPPYDLSGWTLPLQMGVDVDRVEAPTEIATTPVEEPVAAAGDLRGDGNRWLIDPRANAAATAVNDLLAAGATVHRIAGPVDAGSDALPPGAFLVEDGPGIAGHVAQLAEEHGLAVRATERPVRGDGWQLRQPRVGLYEPWVPSMDAGWTRWVLEQHDFPYAVLRDAQVRKGRLIDAYDVILLPSTGVETLVEGHEEGTMPPRYTGGLGAAGIDSLRRFVEDGGTLVAFDRAAELPLTHFDLPVRDGLAELSQDEFFCPGSLLRLRVDPTHPLGYGMPTHATAFFVRSRGFDLAASEGQDEAPAGVATVAIYPQDGQLLESGWILGAEHLQGRSAVVEAEMGSGRVVFLGFRTHLRAQPHETFKLLFNSIYYATSMPMPLP